MDLLTWKKILLATSLLCVSAAYAQILSPGPLGRGHTELEGLSNCTECHVLGKKIDGKHCLACHTHTVLAQQISGNLGLHGKFAAENRPCTQCHKDHRGTDAALSDWSGPKERFDHGRTCWALTGKHAKQACAACHRADLVSEPALAERLRKHAESTYLGLGLKCVFCHFDEHRAQLSTDCSRCHGDTAFRPATAFRHDKTSYPLLGAHASVACDKCHPAVPDAKPMGGPLKPVNAAMFARYKIGEPQGCTSCHRDAHVGKFGSDCSACHTLDAWHRVRGNAKDIAFHEKTRFPLKGLHRDATCESCHPKDKNGGLKTKGLSFASCADCHFDAHFGQIAPDTTGKVSCGHCHNEEGFFPPRYPIVEHERTRFPIRGAHQAVACCACHPADSTAFAGKRPPLVPGAKRKGTELVNFVRLKLPEKELTRCISCHKDVHEGQFTQGYPPKTCEKCHVTESFAQVRFSHNTDSRFPLTGAHTGVACWKCHGRSPQDSSSAVKYRGTPTRCSACHQDRHFGQFGGPGESGADCSHCHTTAAYKPSVFKHGDRRFTDFTLSGNHATVTCARCHPQVEVKAGGKTAWYRGVPRGCADCHEDVHAKNGGGLFAASKKINAGKTPAQTCDLCHNADGWAQVRFNHDQTRLPLTGRHASLACRACHADVGTLALDAHCGSCHRDPHAGRLGDRCERCHDQSSFRSGEGVAAHGQTRFPLYGRHALIPCEQCHQAKSDPAFGGVPTSCEACHLDDYRRTAESPFDHLQAGLGTDCRRCHDAVAWQRGMLPEHERCFPLVSGPHRRIACLSCHTSFPGVNITGCNSFNASCTRCHSCASTDGSHRGVAGYQCADRKCYECHPDGRAGD